MQVEARGLQSEVSISAMSSIEKQPLSSLAFFSESASGVRSGLDNEEKKSRDSCKD